MGAEMDDDNGWRVPKKVYPNLKEATEARRDLWDRTSKVAMPMSFWGIEVTGEVGEVLEIISAAIQMGASAGKAANLIKKIERERFGLPGSRTTIQALAKEIADVVITCYLLASAVGVDLDEEVPKKFNETADAVGIPVYLVAPASCGAEAEAGRCPRCNSPSPEYHPAVQYEGEVEICGHPFHRVLHGEKT